MRACVAFLAVAALCAVATATRDLPEGAGRELLQSPTDCARSIPNCATCRFQFFRGTTTRAMCISCSNGYKVAASGRACWCAPGYYSNATNSCAPCGQGFHCPGARSTEASATRTACAANMNTTTAFGMSIRECTVNPGYGWTASGGVECVAGTFNPGYNTRACTRCPGGLTTTSPGSNRSQDCVAPTGNYFLAGKAVPCAQGTYKPSAGNQDCLKCPTGFTTEPGTVGKIPASSCTYLLPGFSAASGATLGTTNATQCAANFYRTNTVLYSSGAATTCTACPDNMETLPGILGATSKDACLAPPGYGWSGTNQNATVCPVGRYNPGWNRQPCVACDASSGTITTAGTGSTSSDDCYVPAGHSSTKIADGSYTGAACPVNTYGRARNVSGLVEVACDKCLEHTTTLTLTAQTSVDACKTDAGYGYDDGQVNQCEWGTYAPGRTQDACTSCGEGFNTSASDADMTPVQGANNITQCKVAAGWTLADALDSSKGIAPCTRGYYKAVLGNTTCTVCPAGTTTTITMAAVARSDCDACRPGFGNSSIALSSPACGICASGTWSAGFTTGGAACTACPKPALFTGDMVSRQGIFTPEDCVPEFPTDGDQPSFLPWDRINMDAGSLAVQSTITTQTACQAACKADTACQYYVWYNYNITEGSQTQCYLRSATAAIAKLSFTPDATTNVILFEVKEGQYVVYAAKDSSDAANIGTTIASDLSFSAAKTACDGSPACHGFAVAGQADKYRTFSGSKWEGAVGKVRVVGETINSWIATPAP